MTDDDAPRLTQLELEIMEVFARVATGDSLGQTLLDFDASGHVSEYIVRRIHEVSPWIKRNMPSYL